MKILKSSKAVAKAVAIYTSGCVAAIDSLVTLNATEIKVLNPETPDDADRGAFTELRKAVVEALDANGYRDAIGANANTLNGHVNKWLASMAGAENATVKQASDLFVERGLVKPRAAKSTSKKGGKTEKVANATVAKEIADFLKAHKTAMKKLSVAEKAELVAIIMS